MLPDAQSHTRWQTIQQWLAGKLDRPLRVLLTNDDGIYAPGLEVLQRIAAKLVDDVVVVAPESEQSGAGHSLTLHEPLRYRQMDVNRFAVTGTPTDCVLMAVKHILLGREPDLVLSGVNRGSNIGEDITYSGTVAAAMEGTLLGVPAIALSQCFADGQPIQWQHAETHAPELIRRLLNHAWPANTLMNVNFPSTAQVLGVKAAPQGQRRIGDRLTRCTDPRGREYYWIGTSQADFSDCPATDIEAVNDGYISVTPICMDMTDYKELSRLEQFCVTHQQDFSNS